MSGARAREAVGRGGAGEGPVGMPGLRSRGAAPAACMEATPCHEPSPAATAGRPPSSAPLRPAVRPVPARGGVRRQAAIGAATTDGDPP